MRSKTATVFLVLTFAFSATALAPDPVNITIKSAEGNFAPVNGMTYELIFDKEVPWTDSRGANNSDDAAVEFSPGQPKTLSCELLFDTYEKREDVTGTGPSQLLKLADVDPAMKSADGYIHLGNRKERIQRRDPDGRREIHDDSLPSDSESQIERIEKSDGNQEGFRLT